jgi:hypothetical protein
VYAATMLEPPTFTLLATRKTGRGRVWPRTRDDCGVDGGGDEGDEECGGAGGGCVCDAGGQAKAKRTRVYESRGGGYICSCAVSTRRSCRQAVSRSLVAPPLVRSLPQPDLKHLRTFVQQLLNVSVSAYVKYSNNVNKLCYLGDTRVQCCSECYDDANRNGTKLAAKSQVSSHRTAPHRLHNLQCPFCAD